MTASDEQIIELESRLAFQDDSIEQLSDTVARQQRQIDDLTQMVKIINKQLTSSSQDSGSGTADEPPPPHY
ncbi:MAG: SlyX family protein [Motiliproteus sp.]